MKILFLHEVNYLTKPIFEMHEFPEHLSRLGHEVGFVHFPEGYSQSQIRGIGRRKKIPGRVVEGVELDLFTPWTINGSLSGRLVAATVSYWQFKKILRQFKPEVVVSFAVPTSGWQALLASKREKVPYIFRALDVSHKIRPGLFSGMVQLAERIVYRHASSISANNAFMLGYCNQANQDHPIGAVHYPPLDLSMFQEGDREVGRRLIKVQEGSHVTIYLGSFFYFSGLREVITAWRDAPPSSFLLLVGFGELEIELRSLVTDLGLDGKVLFTGPVPFSELPNLLAASDLAINPMERSLVSDAALPNKVLQYLAAGLPVASTRLSGLMSVFDNNEEIVWFDSPLEVGQYAANRACASHRGPSSSIDFLRETFGSRAVQRFEGFIAGVVGHVE